MKKNLFLLALSAVAATPAFADDNIMKNFSGTVGLVSQYTFRGLAQTDEHPALQGSIDFNHESGFYAGVWGSNVDFNDGDEASVEADIYGGWSGEYNGVSFDAGLIYYAYPGADSDLNYDYYELAGSVGYDFDVFSLTGAVNYSPDYFAGSGDGWYTAANAEVPLPLDFKLTGHFGHQFIDDEAAFGSPDYSDWSFGVGYKFSNFDLALNYIDTNLDDGNECVSGWCDSRVVFGLTYAIGP